jgi:hypothetical protein
MEFRQINDVIVSYVKQEDGLSIQIKGGINYLQPGEVKTLQLYLQEYLDTVSKNIESVSFPTNLEINIDLNKRLTQPNPNTRLVNTFNAGDRVKIPQTKSIYSTYEYFKQELDSLWFKLGKTDFLTIFTTPEHNHIGLNFISPQINKPLPLDNDTFDWKDLEHYQITNQQMTEIINIQLNDGILIDKIQNDLQNSKKIVKGNLICIVYDNGVADYYKIEQNGSISFLK